MKVFLDANVLVSVLNKEYPLFPISSRVVSLADRPEFDLYTSPNCLAIAFYFSEKKSGSEMARLKIEMLSKKILMTAVDQATLNQTLANRQVQDLEDGLEYYSAVDGGCAVIVTEDTAGFYYAAIPVMNCRDFLEKYVF